MKTLITSFTSIVIAALLALLSVPNANSMGLRSLVALPLDKYGYVIRFLYVHATNSNSDNFISSAAYGLNNKQALLFSIAYKLTPRDEQEFSELSTLYRHTVIQDDFFSGTSRLALLAGATFPIGDSPISDSPIDNDTGANDPSHKHRDPAIQVGFVYSFFKNRHEFDFDALYQAGIDRRSDTGRYDISWQYRLSPSIYPDWGIAPEIYMVTELGSRWQAGDKITHQVTLGLQWVQSTWVIEGGIVRNLSSNDDLTLLLSSRFHF